MLADFEVQRASASAGIPDDAHMRGWAEAALDGKASGFALVIRVVDEDEARRFNREFRNKDYATNVLSFQAELPEGLAQDISQSLLGDLLICAPVVVREAAQQRRSETDHWAHLVVHGILHLLGYDHEETAAAEVMESLETQILASLGISDPYLDVA